MSRPGRVLATGLVLGWLADRAFGDPSRLHPVAGFGSLAGRFEALVYGDSRVRGVLHEATLVGGAIGLGCLVRRSTMHRPIAGALATAAATWAVLGGRSLVHEADAIAERLAAGDVCAARARVGNIVGRDPESLNAEGIARAALESVAENTSDAVVAPLLWGAVAGVPGLLAYRAVNTLDAMVGYRNERYLSFGWAAAKVDDVANWIPARAAAALAVVAAPLVGGSPEEALKAVREHSSRHPSPNGGVVEAAFAGALGVRLGGRNVYGGVEEDRGTLGYGSAPVAADLTRATRLARVVSLGAAMLAAAIAWRSRW